MKEEYSNFKYRSYKVYYHLPSRIFSVYINGMQNLVASHVWSKMCWNDYAAIKLLINLKSL